MITPYWRCSSFMENILPQDSSLGDFQEWKSPYFGVLLLKTSSSIR